MMKAGIWLVHGGSAKQSNNPDRVSNPVRVNTTVRFIKRLAKVTKTRGTFPFNGYFTNLYLPGLKFFVLTLVSSAEITLDQSSSH